MKLLVRLAMALLVVACFCTLTVNTAQAQYGYGGYGYRSGLFNPLWGGWGLMSPYASGRVPTPPYFALHPPVYYSQPVARTYGYSPFAYSGDVRTPEVAGDCCPEPYTMVNPYVPQDSDEEQTTQTTDDEYAAELFEIDNPYVLDDPTEIDSAELVSVEFLDN